VASKDSLHLNEWQQDELKMMVDLIEVLNKLL